MTIQIIGAGVTGLAFAKACREEVHIYDSAERAGGKAMSYKEQTRVGTFGFDIGGHWFHCQSTPAVLDLLEGLELQWHTRKAYIYLDGQLLPFPIQQSFSEHPDKQFVRRVQQEMQVKHRCPTYDNYEDMLLQSYGRTLYESFFQPYNAKMYGIRDLSGIGVGKYETVRNVRTDKQITGYNGQFLYPKGDQGASGIPLFLAKGLPIQYNKRVLSIGLKQKTMTVHHEQKSWDKIISTIPLNVLMNLIKDVDQELRDLAGKLTYSKGMILNLGVKRTQLQGEMSWVYVPDPRLHFYRVGFYSHVEASLAPRGYCSMYVECSPLFFHTREEAFAMIPKVIRELIELGFIGRAEEIVTSRAFYLDPNYCHPDPLKTERIHQYLEHFGIYSIGRYGSWHWSSQHEDMQQAADLAQRLGIATSAGHTLQKSL